MRNLPLAVTKKNPEVFSYCPYVYSRYSCVSWSSATLTLSFCYFVGPKMSFKVNNKDHDLAGRSTERKEELNKQVLYLPSQTQELRIVSQTCSVFINCAFGAPTWLIWWQFPAEMHNYINCLITKTPNSSPKEKGIFCTQNAKCFQGNYTYPQKCNNKPFRLLTKGCICPHKWNPSPPQVRFGHNTYLLGLESHFLKLFVT